MKNVLKLTALVLCCVALVACSQKGPAEAALTAAQTAVDGVKTEAAKYVPDQAKGLLASLTAAREAFDKGDYKVALELRAAPSGQGEGRRDGRAPPRRTSSRRRGRRSPRPSAR